MSHNLVIPELFQLEQLALHSMAKKLWNNLILQHPAQIYVTMYTVDRCDDLKLFKDKILKALPGQLPQRFPKHLIDKLVDAIIDIKLGYDTAFEWIIYHNQLLVRLSVEQLSVEIHDYVDLKQMCQNVIHSATNRYADKYEAINFMKPLGRFDDLSWAKLFVADESQSLKSRFYLACLYCFEEEINFLWCAMKLNNETLCQEDMLGICPDAGLLIQLWISRLEEETEDSFYVEGWKLAFRGCHEHGVIFFWRHFSDNEQAKILSELKLYRLSAAVLVETHVGFVHFIYSLLSEQWKDKLIRFGNFFRQDVSVLVFLLCSSCYKSILNEILELPPSIPFEFRKQILEALTVKIEESSITRHKEIFKILWNRLLSEEERITVLSSSDILVNLIDINDFDLLEMIVLPLPHYIKEKVLLDDFQMAGPLKLFLNYDYKGYHCYLLILLLDYDTVSGQLTLRSDAANLLDRFMDTDNYVSWSKSCLFKQSKHFSRVTGHLKETLPIVKEQINRMAHGTITRYFLSREIYPLLSVKDTDLNRKGKKEL